MQAADLYDDVPRETRWRIWDFVPGVAVAGAATLAAAYLADHYGAPLTLMALLIGLALNFLGTDTRLSPGLRFSASTLLRWGIVLMGLRITLSQIAGLGPWALAAIVGIVAATIGTGVLISRRLGFGSAFGVLAGGSVAICGASAAMAFAGLLGERRLAPGQLALVLIGISTASALAMFVYPILAHQLGLSDQQAGFMLGASVHDVAQALGAGYAFSTPAGDTAAIAKLSRVALLAPALAVVALFFPADATRSDRPPVLPWFVIGFFAMAALNSTGIVPEMVTSGAQTAGTACLACAVAATGIRSPMSSLMKAGPRLLLVIAVASLAALLLATAGAWFLID
ncbi:MAG: YeiH family protein [Allosphingosinicella sp.]